MVADGANINELRATQANMNNLTVSGILTLGGCTTISNGDHTYCASLTDGGNPGDHINLQRLDHCNYSGNLKKNEIWDRFFRLVIFMQKDAAGMVKKEENSQWTG